MDRRMQSERLTGDLALPQSMRITGRLEHQENGDICGEYFLLKCADGYPVYKSRTTGIVIGYCSPLARWVIDRSGFRDLGTCVAYANTFPNCSHPAHPDLVWHVWNSNAQAHVLDSEVIAFDAPDCFTFVGRDPSRENSVVNGRYKLAGSVHGRVSYRHQQEDLILRFSAQEKRWLIQKSIHPDHVCCAWAEAGSTWHPGEVGEWNFWEPQHNSFIADPHAGVSIAPDVVHILGRHAQSENARINGTYHLVGMHCGRPLYAQPMTHSVIRYSCKHDLWLIDCDGLEKPSLLSRLYHWILTGDSEIAYDRCCAWASTEGTHHPGHADLQWHIWETLGSQHKLDSDVMATSAPLSIEVSHNRTNRENCDLIGEYRFVGCYNRFPAYQKQSSQISMYFSKSGKWVIDRNGMQDLGVCVAYLDCAHGLEHPANTWNSWHVWQKSSRVFALDSALVATASSDTAGSLSTSAQNSGFAQSPSAKLRDAADGIAGINSFSKFGA